MEGNFQHNYFDLEPYREPEGIAMCDLMQLPTYSNNDYEKVVGE